MSQAAFPDEDDWSAEARFRAESLFDAARALQHAFETSPNVGSCDLASNLLSACASLANWLRDAPAPREFTDIDAELRAAIGVYRNAALTFRNLGKGNAAGRARACQRLLAQGQHHVDQVLT